ncbi:MAG: hypothetical protein ACFFD4_17570 [Candidatus Odinarchaeota archaeon]
MDDFNESVQKLKDIFEKSKLKTDLMNKNVLIVLDEMIDRETLLFEIAGILNKNIDASIIFLQAVRGYYSRAEKIGKKLQALPELIKKVKNKFSDRDDMFEVAFIPDEEITPFERINQLIQKRSVHIIVIPAPFTSFAVEEDESESSLGITVDRVLNEIFIPRKIPLMLIKVIENVQIPFTRIALFIREHPVDREIIGWILALAKKDARIDIYHSEDLDRESIEKTEIFCQACLDLMKKESREVIVEHYSEKFSLKGIFYEISKNPGTLVVFQGLKDVNTDIKNVIRILNLWRVNILIFPPITELT